jgi:DNA-binding Lrp family transcriptional regulator
MADFNNKDGLIVELLLEDARAPISTIAKRLGTSRAFVSKRIEELKDKGYIKGFKVVLDDNYIERQNLEHALLLINLENTTCEKVFQTCKDWNGIERFWTTSGSIDLVILITGAKLSGVDETRKSIAAITGVASVRTSVVLKSYK